MGIQLYKMQVRCRCTVCDRSSLLAVSVLVVVGEGDERCRGLIGISIWLGLSMHIVAGCCPLHKSPVSSSGMIHALCTIIECEGTQCHRVGFCVDFCVD